MASLADKVCEQTYTSAFLMIKMTLLPTLVAALISLLCVEYSSAYFIHIDAHAEECFFDKVTSGTKMSLMFEVAEGGFLDIDVKVSAKLC